MSEQSNPPGLRPVSRRVQAPPDAVWAVVSDGWLYANWVVGTSRVREVDSTWPDAGSRIHHSFGVWPAVIDDETVSVQVVPGRSLHLRARGWPMGEARVELSIAEGSDGVVHGHDRRGRRDRTWAACPPSGATGRHRGPQHRGAAPPRAHRRGPASGVDGIGVTTPRAPAMASADVADAVVIGAGPNGLVAANALADAGWDVVLVEQSDRTGGAVRSDTVTAPGFVTDMFSAFYPLAAASSVIRGLDLERHGLTLVSGA